MYVSLHMQYRVSRLFIEKSKTVISRGFQLKHIPSGKVCTLSITFLYVHQIIKLMQCNPIGQELGSS